MPLSPLEINYCWYSVACLFYTLQVGIHILIFFLANLAKGNMSFCHHLVSVVCHPFTFHILIFSENPQPNELKLVGSIYGRSSLKSAHLLWSITKHGRHRQFFFWLADLKKSSPLKPLGQMNWNLVGSIYGMSSMKIAHFVPIG